MAVQKNQVFLVQGQMERLVDGVAQRGPEIEQRVVVAQDARVAYEVLAANEPGFKPIGRATLQDYENAATKLRAAIKGDNVGWIMHIAQGMAG